MPTCIHGKQVVPDGERGTYFICQLKKAYPGNHCRYVRWCHKETLYKATVDKGGNMCEFFSTKKPTEAKTTQETKYEAVTKIPQKEVESDKVDILSEEELELDNKKNISKVRGKK